MARSRRGLWSLTEAGREQRTRCLPRRPSSKRDLGERRELHRALAAVVSDRELQALHMALATSRPDAALAATVAAAAAEASARGGSQEAAMLAEHAAASHRRRCARAWRSVLVLSRYLMIAGEGQRLRDLLMPGGGIAPVWCPARAAAHHDG